MGAMGGSAGVGACSNTYHAAGAHHLTREGNDGGGEDHDQDENQRLLRHEITPFQIRIGNTSTSRKALHLKPSKRNVLHHHFAQRGF
jgi:hypothetical protein